MPDGSSSRWLLVTSLGAVGVGWLLGLVAYDQLIGFMLDRDWLTQTEPLTPSVFAPRLVVGGLVAAALVTWRDRQSRAVPSTSLTVSRTLVAAGVAMTGLGLFHAHAVGQLFIPGPDNVLAKDLLYHGPGIALLVAGHYSRPVRVAPDVEPAS